MCGVHLINVQKSFLFFWLVNKNLSVLTSVISKKSRIWNNWNWTKHEQEDWKWVSVTTLHNKWNVCFLDFYTCILKDLWCYTIFSSNMSYYFDGTNRRGQQNFQPPLISPVNWQSNFNKVLKWAIFM